MALVVRLANLKNVVEKYFLKKQRETDIQFEIKLNLNHWKIAKYAFQFQTITY